MPGLGDPFVFRIVFVPKPEPGANVVDWALHLRLPCFPVGPFYGWALDAPFSDPNPEAMAMLLFCIVEIAGSHPIAVLP